MLSKPASAELPRLMARIRTARHAELARSDSFLPPDSLHQPRANRTEGRRHLPRQPHPGNPTRQSINPRKQVNCAPRKNYHVDWQRVMQSLWFAQYELCLIAPPFRA